MTTEGAKLFVEVLKVNPCLMVLDVRANELIGEFVYICLHEQLFVFLCSSFTSLSLSEGVVPIRIIIIGCLDVGNLNLIFSPR